MSIQHTQYDCHGFHDSLAKGKASGTMTIDDNSILFRIQDQQVRMPLHGLQIYMGGASNRLVFFEHGLLKGWSFYTSDRTILHDTHLKNQSAIAAILAQAKRKRVMGWSSITAVLIIIIALPSALILRMDVATGFIAKKLPPEWEQQLGETTMAQYQLGKNMMDKEQAKPLLDPLVMPLVNALNHSAYTYKFHIVNDGSLNAFALPGGEVVIHSALILRAESAEELLGVLAHEITHVEEQHGIRNVIGTTGIYMVASAVFGDVSGLLAVVSSAAPLLLNQSYSRRFETEADVKGFALLQKAKINPSGLASFFDKMIEEEKKQLEKIEDEKNRELVKDALAFLSTHPASEDRIKRLNELANSAHATDYQSLEAPFLNLQQAVKQFVTEHQGEQNNEE